MKAIPTARLPGGEAVPVLGQGTYRMGEDRAHRRREIAALRTGFDLGMTLVDTAEMYADGGAERIVGEAIAGRREEIFLVSKFYPQNGTRERMRKACERTLRRLATDRLDLYLLHWRGDVPLGETVDGFAELLAEGKIRYAGVSNFDVDDLGELARLKNGIERIVTNEVLFNLEHRGPEWDLLPWSRRRRRPVLAYSPVEEGLLSCTAHPTLGEIAARHGATAAQVAIAWIIRHPGVIAIPKASRPAHVRENRGAVELRLSKRDLDELDVSFPAPTGKIPLETR